LKKIDSQNMKSANDRTDQEKIKKWATAAENGRAQTSPVTTRDSLHTKDNRIHARLPPANKGHQGITRENEQ
jgi:hypothetical protein